MQVAGVTVHLLALSGACLGTEVKLASDNIPFGSVVLGSQVILASSSSKAPWAGPKRVALLCLSLATCNRCSVGIMMASHVLQCPCLCPARSRPAPQVISAALSLCDQHILPTVTIALGDAVFGAAGQWTLQHISWQPLQCCLFHVHAWQLEGF